MNIFLFVLLGAFVYVAAKTLAQKYFPNELFMFGYFTGLLVLFLDFKLDL